MSSAGLLSSIALLVIAAACDSASPVNTSPQPEQGRVTATVRGSVETVFHGTGWFTSDPDPRLGLARKFGFDSRGVGASEGDIIFGTWFEGGIPPVGSYSFTVPKWGTAEGLWMYYLREHAARLDHYVISDGTLDITGSSAERVDGRFLASAWLRCSHSIFEPVTVEVCPDLDGTLPRIARIELSGSFSLVPFDQASVITE